LSDENFLRQVINSKDSGINQLFSRRDLRIENRSPTSKNTKIIEITRKYINLEFK
jgi:hypothetical protein